MGGVDNSHQEYNLPFFSFILPLCFNPNIGVVGMPEHGFGVKIKGVIFFCKVAIMGRGYELWLTHTMICQNSARNRRRLARLYARSSEARSL